MLAVSLFYLFSGLLLTSAACVIFMRETVHSVFFLIFAFINAAGLFLLAGAEFLAMILVIVYVGAVAVLFLFVVMMLGVDLQEFKERAFWYKWLAGAAGAVFGVILITVMFGWVAFPESFHLCMAPINPGISNTQQLGMLLYTHYFLSFQIAGLILLVAMIGAIVLTLRLREGVKRQAIDRQLKQQPQTVVELVDTPIGKGIQS